MASEQAHTLISAEALAKLHALRLRLQQIPGVFFDNRHHHSIRAFTYRQAPRGLLASLRSTGAATAPLPDLMMTQLMTELGQDLLSWHQTSIDTTIISRGVDKGTGLLALRERLLDANADMIAVGDSEPDLPMFRAATQGYAPAHIACVVQAKLLGCQIARAPYQRGLLEITRALIHPDHQNCPQCAATEFIDGHDPWLHVLRAADGPAVRNLLRALQGHGSIRAFLRY